MEQGRKDSLKVQALTQRIAQVVAQYEEQLAEVRAEATIIIEDLQAENAQLKESAEDGDVGESSVEVEPEADSAK